MRERLARRGRAERFAVAMLDEKGKPTRASVFWLGPGDT
jgi:hypothetical protein